MTFVEAIQLLAFRDVLLETPEYRVRSIQRWYSTTFNTPLLTVENDIPLAVVIQHYYETLFETMEPEQLEETKKLLLETDAQRRERLKAEDAEAAGSEEIHVMLEEEAKRLAANPKAANLPIAHTPRDGGQLPETRLPDTLPQELPPDIHLTFVTPEELERRVEDFGAVPSMKKQS